MALGNRQDGSAEGDHQYVWDDRGISLLHWAVQTGSPEMVQLMVDQGFDVNVRTRDRPDGRPPLYMAKNKAVARVLLDAGADPEARIAGYTLMEMADMNEEFWMVELLREYGAKE